MWFLTRVQLVSLSLGFPRVSTFFVGIHEAISVCLFTHRRELVSEVDLPHERPHLHSGDGAPADALGSCKGLPRGLC